MLPHVEFYKDKLNMWQESSKSGNNPFQKNEYCENHTLKIVAVRLRKISDAEIAFAPNEAHKNQRKLVASRVERRDPALRNLVDGLEKNGMQYIVDGCALYWLQIDDQNSLEYYQRMNEVECVFSCEWFDQFKKNIRYFQGMQYVDECMRLANQFYVKNQLRKIDYIR